MYVVSANFANHAPTTWAWITFTTKGNIMPRVENTGDNVSEWYENDGDSGSSTLDVCNVCYKELLRDPKSLNNKLRPYNGDPQGDSGWVGDIDRPDYDDQDYCCEGPFTCFDNVCPAVISAECSELSKHVNGPS